MHYTLSATLHPVSPFSDRPSFYKALSALGLRKSGLVETTWNGITSGPLKEIEEKIVVAARLAHVGLDYQLSSNQPPIEGSFRPLTLSKMVQLASLGISPAMALSLERRSSAHAKAAGNAFQLLGKR